MKHPSRSVSRTCLFAGLLLLSACGGDNGRAESEPPRGDPQVCNLEDNPNMENRPTWGQVMADNGAPDLAYPSQNIKLDDSLLLLASLMQVVTDRLDGISTARSECVCEGNPVAACEGENTCTAVLGGDITDWASIEAEIPYPDSIPASVFAATGIEKLNCETYCQSLESNGLCEATGTMLGWRKNDLLMTLGRAALKALTHMEWLDGFAEKVGSDRFAEKIEAGENAAEGLRTAANDLRSALSVVDDFTEGFHLGAYAEDRPDLWYCVPRAGGNVYAPLFDLMGGQISVGSRWRSGLAAKRVRAQFGWTTPVVRAFGLEIPMGFNVNLNTQINAFKLFHREKFLGLDVGDAGVDLSWAEALETHDAFNILGTGDWVGRLQSISGSDRLSLSGLLAATFYPVQYQSADGDDRVWPGPEDDGGMEARASAVMGAGVNWRHDFGDLLEPSDEADTAPIEEAEAFLENIKQPKVSANFGVYPYVKLGLSLELFNEASRLLTGIVESLNAGLPEGVEPLSLSELTRDDEAWMQAPDVSRDLGIEATVSPEVGVKVGGTIEAPGLTVEANLGLGIYADLSPGFAGDTVDTSRAVADALGEITPENTEACVPQHNVATACGCTADFIAASQLNYACALSATAAGAGALAGGDVAEPDAATRAVYQCDAYGTCIEGATRREDVVREDCSGEYVPYERVEVETPLRLRDGADIEWTGGCHPLLAGFEAEDASRIVDDIRNRPDEHSIFTYAASTMRLVAGLTGFYDVRLEFSLPFKLFGKSPTIRIRLHDSLYKALDPVGDINLVQGLRADYEPACNAEPVFTVLESQSNFVLDHDVENESMDDWCFGTVPDDESYFGVPEQNEDTLADLVNGLKTLGKETATQLWSANELCVGGEPLLEVAQDPSRYLDMMCTVGGQELPCDDLDGIVTAGNCGTATPFMLDFCDRVGCDVVGGQVQLSTIPDNVASEEENPVNAWLDGVASCLADLEIGMAESLLDQAQPCCGDGVVQGSESTEFGGCDDGNRTDGDGCSSMCRLEPFGPAPGGGGGCDVCTEGDFRPLRYECLGTSAVVEVGEECVGCAWVEVEDVIDTCTSGPDGVEICDPEIAECRLCDPAVDRNCPEV